MADNSHPLASRLDGAAAGGSDEILNRFMDYVAQKGLALYPAQEEAILEIMSGRHIILNTPTGSGKSLVATAMIFRSVVEGRRTFYTCPIKALVSEKFFALCNDFGPDRVGMMTGDAAINRDAPIICCTAEILSNMALREGPAARIDTVVMDEFHYYGDRDRGVAWQVPLLMLEKATFLLMSATLGNPEFFADKLKELTGRDTAIVRSRDRPVPLDYEYRETPFHETLDELMRLRKYPVYVVNFTQRAAAEEAQNMMSVNFCSREEKQAINEALQGVLFDTPYGKEVQKFLRHGLGLHHAGLLPKYRLLTEKLAQQGLLKIISGTDTLGVGVNIPIRTVLFTKLCKYDGEKTGILSVRDFKQISGRAGRRGFDTQGSVVVQAPEHVIENLRIEAKKQSDPQKYKKLQKARPPDKGFVHWDRATFDKLIARDPEDLPSRFNVTHGMLVHLLQAEIAERGGGYGRLMRLCARSHGDERAKRHVRRHARQLFQSLRAAGIIRVERVPMAAGAFVRVEKGLQRDFSLNQTLSLYLLDTLPRLDREADAHSLDVLTLVESILEDPDPILFKQLDKLKGEKIAEWKAQGMEYDQRMEELEKLEYPKPHRDFIYDTFNAFAAKHPWVGRENIRPKSVAREMYERYASFNEYTREYSTERVEGLLLRYLSDVYKTLVQTVPEAEKTDEVLEIESYFRALVHGVDKSLVEEWESLRTPVEALPEGKPRPPPSLADNPRLLRARIRGEVHHLVKTLSEKDWTAAALALAESSREEWTPVHLEEAMKAYFADYPSLRMDHDARSPRLTLVTETGPRCWDVRQTLLDPEGDGTWFLDCVVDLQGRTGAEGPLLGLRRIGT
ncbi:MAG: DUF3516 domain-containing protein [Deltaproteobacteria bacterium]|nr:DUF3516 domain-containing protein [Deltaproteobacteria bacterium]